MAGVLRLFGVNIDVKVADEDTLSIVDPTVYNPMPLRCLHPEIIPQAGFRLRLLGNFVKFLSPDNNGSTEGQGKSGKRKRGGEKKKRRRGGDDPVVPIEEIPGLLQAIEKHNGSRPVFVFGKKLEESDVRKNQNRLFVSTDKNKFGEFLSGHESKDLEKGIEVDCVDEGGNDYKFGLKIWKSLQQLVVKKDWNKLVKKKEAKKGNWVQIWGFRGEHQKPCLAIHILKNPNTSASEV